MPTSSLSDGSIKRLAHFCETFKWEFGDVRIPIRIESPGLDHAAYTCPALSPDMFIESCAPIPLSELLEKHRLSPRSKISLAFAFSKSFWQYYESEWMKARWYIETMNVLLQGEEIVSSTLDTMCQSPFLQITSSDPVTSVSEGETQEEIGGITQLHHYPYILTLGLLLIQLCLRDSATRPRRSSGPTRNNDIYTYCLKEAKMARASWPVLDLSDEYRPCIARLSHIACLSYEMAGPAPCFAKSLMLLVDAACGRKVLSALCINSFNTCKTQKHS
jgi:hypothetical protein